MPETIMQSPLVMSRIFKIRWSSKYTTQQYIMNLLYHKVIMQRMWNNMVKNSNAHVYKDNKVLLFIGRQQK